MNYLNIINNTFINICKMTRQDDSNQNNRNQKYTLKLKSKLTFDPQESKPSTHGAIFQGHAVGQPINAKRK